MPDPLPPVQQTADQDYRPSKRARKAINCDPCRQSKLKCDRARPCSGCVLRGSVAQCYPNERPDTVAVASDEKAASSDVRAEIARIRQALAALEAHTSRSGPPAAPSSSQYQVSTRPRNGPSYDDPTFLGSALSILNNDRSEDDADKHSPDNSSDAGYDDTPRNMDLIQMLPEHIDVIEDLFAHYFEACTWIYRYLDEPNFTRNWTAFKQSHRCDSLTLAIFFVVIAISLQYTPPRHRLLNSFSEPPIVLGSHYYALANVAYARHRATRHNHTLDSIEFILIKVHFLSISTRECEEIWTLRGDVISAAIALNLHRDPGDLKISSDAMERRRWLWWNVMGIGRWHAFLFGRPPGVTNDHFSTQFPVESCAKLDSTGPAHAGSFHLHSFRLVHLLGDILDTAVSLRPISYDRILAHDEALEEWLRTIPPVFDMDKVKLALALSASSNTANNRCAMQCLYLKGTGYHIRFTLHRPYTTPAAQQDTRLALSFERAATYAQKLIELYNDSIQDFFENHERAVAGNVSQGPVHLFAAAAFLCSQLISRPEQPGSYVWRENIRQVSTILSRVQTVAPAAARGLAILRALAPMFDEKAKVNMDERKRRDYLEIARQLASSSYHVVDVPPPPPPPPPPSTSRTEQPAHQPQLNHSYNRNIIPVIPQQHIYGPSPYVAADEAIWSAALGLDTGAWSDYQGVCGPR